ncbi:MAG: hypothetical protein HY512_01355 [Candidatus Aenigmarchaeota archaeon]|nr:hypothetical protein [Candidatus Aenigmarchaeota archaeon]
MCCSGIGQAAKSGRLAEVKDYSLDSVYDLLGSDHRHHYGNSHDGGLQIYDRLLTQRKSAEPTNRLKKYQF